MDIGLLEIALVMSSGVSALDFQGIVRDLGATLVRKWPCFRCFLIARWHVLYLRRGGRRVVITVLLVDAFLRSGSKTYSPLLVSGTLAALRCALEDGA